MKLYKLTTPEHNEKTGKTFWHTIGTLFADDTASGIHGSTIKLGMFPDLMIKVYHRDEPKKNESKQPEPPDEVYQEPEDTGEPF